jgi:hypothetical protein
MSVDEAIDDIDRGRVTYYIEPTPDADRSGWKGPAVPAPEVSAEDTLLQESLLDCS